MEKVVIIGGKGTAVVIAEQLYDAQHRFGQAIEMLGFAFDDPAFGPEINGFPVVCKTYEAYDKYRKFRDVKFVFSLYRHDIIEERVKLRESYGIPTNRYCSFVHPTAYVARSALLGSGCVVCANVVINPSVVLGDHTTLNSGSLIGHDTKIGENSFVAGHACVGSNVNISNGVFIGLNATVRNYMNVGDFAVIGMAANVISNVESRAVVLGNPARAVRKQAS